MKGVVIPIKGLSEGAHSFDFTIDNEFFSEFGNTQIKDADFAINVIMQRFASYLRVECHSKGYVVVECDRCLDDLQIPIDVTSRLNVRFVREEIESENDEEICVDESSSELDLSQEIYDYICLSMPLQKVHPEGECNSDVIRYLTADEGQKDAGESAYSPFGKLKDLLENNNKLK